VLKLIVFSKPYWPSIGGVESSSRIMARALADGGHQVTVITATPLEGLIERDGDFAVCRNASLPSLLRHLSSSSGLIINGGLSVPAAFAAWLRHKPFAVWHQMAGGELNEGDFPQNIRNRLAGFFSNRAAIHVGVSEACLASKELPSHLPRTVIFNPVASELEVQAVQKQQSPKDIDVLFVGRLLEGKGVFILADALARMSAGGMNLRAAFVGIGPDERRLRDALEKTPGVHCEFFGGLTSAQLADVYPRAHCLAVPSTTHPEGLPLVIGEALTFGVPVVGSDQPAIIEAVGDAGLISPRGDAAALAEAIGKLLADQVLRNKLSRQAFQRAGLFSSAKFGEAVRRVAAGMKPVSA
jgi:glycosyltransferase involved in cell wall biosynthesis